ncbi:molybdenum cofactor guanylyltransferase [Chloroflexota bacterium]
MKVTSIILAGGKNKRLGQNKATMTIDGQIVIERIVDRLTPFTDQFIVVAGWGTPDPPIYRNIEVITDLFPKLGPLGGIYTGLQASQALCNVVVACDMPFLNTKLLEYMIGLSCNFDAVIPKLGKGKTEPLHAIYSKNCLNYIQMQLELKILEVNYFLNKVHVRYVQKTECQRLDPQLLSFFNINYQSDLDQAITLTAVNDH